MDYSENSCNHTACFQTHSSLPAMVLGHLLLLLGLAMAQGADPEEWAREKSTLTSRIKELEAEVAASWCDTRDTRGFVVSGLMVNCPAGQVFPGTGKVSTSINPISCWLLC